MSKTHDIDNIPIKGGKYGGKTPEQIADIAPAYIVELYEKRNPPKVTRDLYLACVSAVEEAADPENEAQDSPW